MGASSSSLRRRLSLRREGDAHMARKGMGVRRPSLLERAKGRKKTKRGDQKRTRRLPHDEDRVAHRFPDDSDYDRNDFEDDEDAEQELEYHFEAPQRKEDPRRRELRKIVKSTRASADDVMRARICSRRFDMNMHLADDGEESDDEDEDDVYDLYDEEVADLFQPVY